MSTWPVVPIIIVLLAINLFNNVLNTELICSTFFRPREGFKLFRGRVLPLSEEKITPPKPFLNYFLKNQIENVGEGSTFSPPILSASIGFYKNITVPLL